MEEGVHQMFANRNFLEMQGRPDDVNEIRKLLVTKDFFGSAAEFNRHMCEKLTKLVLEKLQMHQKSLKRVHDRRPTTAVPWSGGEQTSSTRIRDNVLGAPRALRQMGPVRTPEFPDNYSWSRSAHKLSDSSSYRTTRFQDQSSRFSHIKVPETSETSRMGPRLALRPASAMGVSRIWGNQSLHMNQLIEHKERNGWRWFGVRNQAIWEASGLEEQCQNLCAAGCYVPYRDDNSASMHWWATVPNVVFLTGSMTQSIPKLDWLQFSLQDTVFLLLFP